MFGYYSDNELSAIGFGSIGYNVMISRGAEIVNASKIFIGDNCRIDTFVILAPSGNSIIRIGDHVQIAAYTLLNGLEPIILDDFSGISSHCTIVSSADDLSGNSLTNATIDKAFLGTISAPVCIGRHAVIGTGSTILPGVTIAEGTVVGAHSLVRENTDPFTIVAGIPAREINKRSKILLELEKKFRTGRK